ncbi:MAG: polyprenyl synthetase family protein [Pseudomonadota bacterium]
MITQEILDDLRVTHLPAVEIFMRESINVLPGGGGLLGEMANYQLDTGGKRFRALIPLAAYEAFGGHPEDAVPIAGACELFHNATLVHDDVQDGDRMRRGRPTIWARWGIPQAINLGDAMMAWAGTCIAETPSEDHVRCGLTGMLHFTMAVVAAGQAADACLQTGETPTPEAWCDVAEAKTGALFGLCLAGPATLAGATDDVHRALLGAARHLGILFQLQDDLVDLYGAKGREGPGGDIREGKMTLPVIHALRLARPAERDRLLSLLGTPRDACSNSAVRWAAELIREVGAVDACLQEMLRRRRDLSQASMLDDLTAVVELIRDLGELFSEPLKPIFLGSGFESVT